MKRTVEYTLLIIGAVFSILGAGATLIFRFFAQSEEFKTEFENSFDEQMAASGAQGQEISADQALSIFGSATTFGIVIFAISFLLAIAAIFLVKRRRVLAGILAVIAGIISIFVLNIISLLLLIVAGIMLFVRKNKNNEQFEEVAFQNDNLNSNSNQFDRQNENNIKQETEKKKKDDDPYIY